MGGSPQSSGGLKAECHCHGGRTHRVLPCAPLPLQVSAFLRIRRKFTQDRHWKSSQERPPKEILAGQGYDSPGFCRAEARRLSRLDSQRVGSHSEKTGAEFVTDGVKEFFHGPELNHRRVVISRRTPRVARFQCPEGLERVA